jgi:hypothetical protein
MNQQSSENEDETPELPLVLINPAIVWICPNCSGENFARMVLAELTPEERIERNLSTDPEMAYLTPPELVECGRCGLQCETDWRYQYADQEEGDFDDDIEDDLDDDEVG